MGNIDGVGEPMSPSARERIAALMPGVFLSASL